MEREEGSYIRTKSRTAAISSVFAADLNKRWLGAIWIKAHPASAPFTVLLPPRLLRAIISESLLPLGTLTWWQTSTGAHGNPLHNWVPQGWEPSRSYQAGSEGGKRGKKKICLCSDLQSLKSGRTRGRQQRLLV